MGLKPSFEKRRLPQPGMSLRAHFRFRFGKHVIDEFLPINSSLPCGSLRENVLDEIEKGPAQIAKRRYREIAFRSVDHLGWHESPGSFLQHVLSAGTYLQAGGNSCGKLNQV